jgi:hypothetical protein
MVTSATPPCLSFFSSSIFLTSSNQTPKLSSSIFRPNSLKTPAVKPLLLTSQLATLPVLSFTGEKISVTQLELKSAPPETAQAVVHRAIITDLRLIETEYLCFGDFLLRRPLSTVNDEQDEECDLLPLSLAPVVQNED